MQTNEFTISKLDLNDYRWDAMAETLSVREGEVELTPLRFGFTSNNVSYARNGTRMRYWDYFPARDHTRGIVPVWGIAEVAVSASDALGAAELVYGLLPVRERFLARVASNRDGTLVECSSHRPDDVPIYNTYRRISVHPNLDSDLGMLFSPLFGTAFLLSDHLARDQLLDAGRVFIMSASSKTGLSTAYLLKRRLPNVAVFGLSGPSNVPWLSKLGIYEGVHGYDDVASIDCSDRCVLLDFSGNRAAVETFMDRLGDNLAFGLRLGTTDWRTSMSVAEAKRRGFSTFFAPDHLAAAVSQWGWQGYLAEQARALDEFVRSAENWITIRRFHGHQGMVDCYETVLQNQMPANQAAIVALADG